MQRKLKKRLLIIALICTIGIAGLILLINSLNLTSPQKEEDELKFNKQSWIHFKTKDSENVRHYMLTDLRTNYLKKGIDSNEVIKILGKPERKFGFSYDLGFYESGFDPSFLIIEFDKKGALIKISVQTI